MRSSGFRMSPVFIALFNALCLHVSNPYGPPGRDCGSTPPDRRTSTHRAEASAPQAIRPVPLDSVVLGMAGVAALAPYPEARHGPPLASERVRSLLDVEVAPKARATGGGCLDSRPDSTDESVQQVVGSTENSWRAPQVGNRSGAIDCR